MRVASTSLLKSSPSECCARLQLRTCSEVKSLSGRIPRGPYRPRGPGQEKPKTQGAQSTPYTYPNFKHSRTALSQATFNQSPPATAMMSSAHRVFGLPLSLPAPSCGLQLRTSLDHRSSVCLAVCPAKVHFLFLNCTTQSSILKVFEISSTCFAGLCM